MRILLTGNTGYITKEWIQDALGNNRIVLVGTSALHSNPVAGLTVLPAKGTDFKQLFDAYAFDCVIIFSNKLTMHSSEVGELDQLETLLKLCQEHSPIRVLYLDGPRLLKGQEDVDSHLAEYLCMRQANSALKIQVLHSLHLYSGVYEKDYFYHMFAELDRRKHFNLDEPTHQWLHFLSMDDLAELVRRILEEEHFESSVMHVPECFEHTFTDLERRLKEINTGWTLTYSPRQDLHTVAEDDRILRTKYNWFPKFSVLDDLPGMAEAFQQVKPEKRTLHEYLSEWRNRHSKLFLLLELALAVLLTILCGHLSKWQVQFGLVDFRLLLIVLMGTMHGMNMGLLAAGVASVMLLWSYHLQHVNWLTMFYEPSNWIVFIVYFTVGAVCGYVRLIDKDKIRFALEEVAQLKDKLGFLRTMYHDVLSDKREYKKQIVSSKDSFGKIFEVTQRLNVTHEKEVFIQAVDILEKVMDNQSIALYSVQPGQRFGRLIAASRQIGDSLTASISLENFSAAMPAIQHGDVFANTDLLEGYPAYMAGLQHNGAVRMLVMLYQADYQQMSLYHMNLFKILCGLIESALTHTMESQEILQAQQCIPGTSILKAVYFEKKLDLDRTMDERKIATHLLLKLDCRGKSIQEMDQLLRTRLRTSDTIGLANDEQLYVILAQANRESLPIITNRLENVGIGCTLIDVNHVA